MSDRDRDNLRRQVEFRMSGDPDGDGRTFEGYAAVFNEWTEITDRYGTFMERVSPGAFNRTLGQRAPVFQFDHGQHPLIGSIPLGRITKIEEDGRGLFVRAKMHDNWLIEPIRDAVREQSIDGMSFRFSVKDDEWTTGEDGKEYRTIKEVALYEVGPVVHPAYSGTSASVRSRQVMQALTDPEVRSELASLFQMGTDELKALADDESLARDQTPPAEGTSDSSEAPAPEGHARTRSKAQRQAIARLALESQEDSP